MLKRIAILGLPIVMFAAMHLGCGFAKPLARVDVLPLATKVFTSTRSITRLCVDGSGALWAATTGGVLRRGDDGVWTKYSARDGLPSNEAQRVGLNAKGEVVVLTPRGSATWRDGKWFLQETKSAATPLATFQIEWRGKIVQAAPDVFRIRPKGTMDWKTIDLPPSRASHVTSLLVVNGELWCGLYGDGVWKYGGDKWEKLDIAQPEDAREVTALAFHAKTKTLWLGTRSQGVWEYSGTNGAAGWQQHLQADEPLDHNVQNLLMFDGSLYASTLDDGLQVRDESGWHALGASTLSSRAPRHLVEFGSKLYVRHGSGKVDVFDGSHWSLDQLSKVLPRKKVFALASDLHKLYAAQWGGWSEWDGKNWQDFLKIPDLQGLPVMGLLPDGDTLWIATQSRGLAEYSHAAGTLKWHDERDGLSDDWITALAEVDGKIYAGTFVGGLAVYDGRTWKTATQLEGENVTDIETDGQGGVLIATRRGVWEQDAKGVLSRLNDKWPWLGKESQAICVTKKGVWIGGRTGVFWLTWERGCVKNQ